jgi:hypothetical protein
MSLLGVRVFTPTKDVGIAISSQVNASFLLGLSLLDKYTVLPGSQQLFIEPELGQ